MTERPVRGNGSRVSKPVEDGVAKPEWGLKRTCRECGKRFYDFHRDPIVCPGCQAVFDPLATLRPRRGRSAPAAAVPVSKAVVEEEPDEAGKEEDAGEDVVEVEDDAVIDTEDDDGMIESDSDLGDDEISDVIADEEG